MHRYRPLIILFGILGISYGAEMLLIPAGYTALNRYQLGASNEKLLGLIMLLPTVVIWSFALFAFIRFRHYAKSISEANDGRSLLMIANGTFGLAIWLPIASLINNFTSYMYHAWPHAVEEATIVKNYLIVTVLFITFLIIWRGSRKLVRTLPDREFSSWCETIYRIAFIVICVASTLLLIHEPYRSAAPRSGLSAFYLPDWLIATTIMLPYLCVWYMGLFSVRNIILYRKHVNGILYKQALKCLTAGLVVLILTVLANRFIYILSSWFNGLAMRYVLVILYGLLATNGVGSLLIAQGAKKLQRIEEA